MMSGSDAILQRMMTLHPKVIDLTLGRMHRILAALGHPERSLPPVIHLAGTNGKGSTQAMIRAGLEANGKRVHAYTSPHLARFHERIRLAGDLISEDMLSDYLDRCANANGGEEITYFEITTAAAILAMSETEADYTLLETGLGGVLDATNVVDAPRLTVITPIDIDHQEYLGDTIAKIAGEKAGIIKRECPCVVSRQCDEALDVIERQAQKCGAPLIAQGQHWHIFEEHGRLAFQDERGLLDLPLPALSGPHQIENAGTALAALRELGCDEAACAAAMTEVEWPARMQRLQNGRINAHLPNAELWLDGGHNPAAATALAGTLKRLPERPTIAICGMLNTKDSQGFFRVIAPHLDHLISIEIPGEAASHTAEELAQSASEAGIDAQPTESLDTALSKIAEKWPNARVLICGSLYLAGHVLRKNQ